MVETLLVDDNPDFLALFDTLLSLDGRFAIVGRADSLDEAARLLCSTAPELIVTDLVVGSERLDILRQFVDAPGAPRVAVVSAHDRGYGEPRALSAGAHVYIPKTELAGVPDTLHRLVTRARRGQD